MDTTNNRLQHNFFLLLLAGSGLIMFFIFAPFLTALILAFSFSVVFRPLYNRILKHSNGRSGISALATVGVVIVAVLIPFVLVGGLLLAEAQGLYSSIASNGGGVQVVSRGVENIERYIQGFAPNVNLNVAEYVQYGLQWVVSHLGTLFSSFLNITIGLFLMLITLFYLLRDGDALKSHYLSLSPLSNKYDQEILERLSAAINSVIKGSLVIAIVQGTLAALGVWIFGLSNPILWGVCATIASLIPGFGTALVMFPAVVYLFIIGDTGNGIGLLIWQVAVVGLVDNFLTPYLLNRGIKIHPLLVLISVLGGIVFFGPIGFLLGPIVLAFFFALLHIYPMILTSHVEKDR
ncbi:MAG: AI-2E family transporter [Patescibacteria group bacterium]